MSLLEYLDSAQKKQERDHFTHLVQIAMADARMEPGERDVLFRIGSNLGFTQTAMEEIVESVTGTAHQPPVAFEQRFEHVYHMMRMILADGEVSLNEMRLAYTFTAATGFEPQETDALINLLLSGIRAGKDMDQLLREYRQIKSHN